MELIPAAALLAFGLSLMPAYAAWLRSRRGWTR